MQLVKNYTKLLCYSLFFYDKNELFTNAKCYLFLAKSIFIYKSGSRIFYCVCLVFCNNTIYFMYVQYNAHTTTQQELNLCKQVNCLSDFTLEYLKHFWSCNGNKMFCVVLGVIGKEMENYFNNDVQLPC